MTRKNKPGLQSLSDELRRQMIRHARMAGADNEYVNAKLFECADDWVTEFEETHQVQLTEDEQAEARRAYQEAFFDPDLVDAPIPRREKAKPAASETKTCHALEDHLDHCDMSQAE